MTVKCKKCGNSYDSKYRVCPQCGTVRFVAPAILRVLALIAGGYLVLTAVMLPLGLFQFKPELTGGEAVSPSPSDVGMVSPAPSDMGIVPPTLSAEPVESNPLPETPSEGEPDTRSLEIKTAVDTKIHSNEEGFIWDKKKGTLQVYIYPTPVDDGIKTKWESSDNTVFTIDENGLLTPTWAKDGMGKGTLTVTHGNAKASFEVWINAKSTDESTTPSVAPTQAPEVDRGFANND